jgi:peptidylprolyl isomerase
MVNVKKGDLVQVNYVGKFESGEIFDQSKDKPLEFIAGEKMVVKGFDEAIIGMAKAEKKVITIKPADGYGDSNPALTQEVPKEAFGDKVGQLEEGVVIGLQHPNAPGQMMPAKVTKIEKDKIHLDLNHPLAGKTLIFDLEVVDFHEATDEDKKKFMPPKPPQAAPEDKAEEKKEDSPEESCDGDCAGCGHKH